MPASVESRPPETVWWCFQNSIEYALVPTVSISTKFLSSIVWKCSREIFKVILPTNRHVVKTARMITAGGMFAWEDGEREWLVQQMDCRPVAAVFCHVWWWAGTPVCLLRSPARPGRHLYGGGGVRRPVFCRHEACQFETLHWKAVSSLVHRDLVTGASVRLLAFASQ